MKQTVLILLGSLVVWGCTQPADVELSRGGYETDMEVLAVSMPDTNVIVPDVDSTGVMAAELLAVEGVMLVSDIWHEASSDNIANTSHSLVFYVDSTVRDLGGRTIGYSGDDLGLVTLNGEPMMERPHRVVLRRVLRPDTTLLRGVEYIADLTGRYQEGGTYTWNFSNARHGNRTESIVAPPRVQVQSPPVFGAGVVDRRRDLELLWRGGQGAMSIVISTFDPVTRKMRPLLQLRSRANSGRALLPAKILQQLPPLQRRFVFTFVLANRREIVTGTGRVLVQAASVVNRFVELR